MATAIQVYEQPQQPKSMATIGAERTALRNLMKEHMKEGVHFMLIPGTPKPSLTKPGSELILSMLHIAAEPIVDDLSTPDEMRYRVFVQLAEMGSGRVLGKGVGEASSAESKYQWRAVVCNEEWEMTREDRRRVIWKKGNPAYPVRQVRTEMSDVANTILKMAKKRAQIDACLTTTAASDLFMQDAEEVIAAGLELQEDAPPPPPARPATLQPKPQAQPQTIDGRTDYGFQPKHDAAQAEPQQQRQAPVQASGAVISEAQARRFKAIGRSTGKEYSEMDAYCKSIGIGRIEDCPKSRYDEVIAWAEAK